MLNCGDHEILFSIHVKMLNIRNEPSGDNSTPIYNKGTGCYSNRAS